MSTIIAMLGRSKYRAEVFWQLPLVAYSDQLTTRNLYGQGQQLSPDIERRNLVNIFCYIEIQSLIMRLSV